MRGTVRERHTHHPVGVALQLRAGNGARSVHGRHRRRACRRLRGEAQAGRRRRFTGPHAPRLGPARVARALLTSFPQTRAATFAGVESCASRTAQAHIVAAGSDTRCPVAVASDLFVAQIRNLNVVRAPCVDARTIEARICRNVPVLASHHRRWGVSPSESESESESDPQPTAQMMLASLSHRWKRARKAGTEKPLPPHPRDASHEPSSSRSMRPRPL